MSPSRSKRCWRTRQSCRNSECRPHGQRDYDHGPDKRAGETAGCGEYAITVSVALIVKEMLMDKTELEQQWTSPPWSKPRDDVGPSERGGETAGCAESLQSLSVVKGMMMDHLKEVGKQVAVLSIYSHCQWSKGWWWTIWKRWGNSWLCWVSTVTVSGQRDDDGPSERGGETGGCAEYLQSLSVVKGMMMDHLKEVGKQVAVLSIYSHCQWSKGWWWTIWKRWGNRWLCWVSTVTVSGQRDDDGPSERGGETGGCAEYLQSLSVVKGMTMDQKTEEEKHWLWWEYIVTVSVMSVVSIFIVTVSVMSVVSIYIVTVSVALLVNEMLMEQREN